MSCEKLREQILQLKSELPEEDDDWSKAHQIAFYLQKECSRQPHSHTAAILEGFYNPDSSREQFEEEANLLMEDIRNAARQLLTKHGYQLEEESLPKA